MELRNSVSQLGILAVSFWSAGRKHVAGKSINMFKNNCFNLLDTVHKFYFVRIDKNILNLASFLVMIFK